MTLAEEQYADLRFTVNRQARRHAQRSRVPMTVKLKVTRLHTIADIPMTVTRIETPAEIARFTAWQERVSELMHENDALPEGERKALPGAPYSANDLQVPANVISLMRRFVFDSRPANIDEAVTAHDLYRKLKAVPDSARTVELTDDEHAYVMALVNIAAVQQYGLNAPILLAAFTDYAPGGKPTEAPEEPTPISAARTARAGKTAPARKPATRKPATKRTRAR